LLYDLGDLERGAVKINVLERGLGLLLYWSSRIPCAAGSASDKLLGHGPCASNGELAAARSCFKCNQITRLKSSHNPTSRYPDGVDRERSSLSWNL
jgi:hypothetical protein